MNYPCEGLSSAEVAERQRAGLINSTSVRSTRSVKKIIASNLFTYFNLLFLIITILLISAGSELRNFTFLPLIITNSLIGIIQELRAKKVLDDLQVLSAPTATVIRDGKKQKIPVSELVLDDVVFLKAGDQISADAQLISGEISVNEALLSGESDEIKKTQKSTLMSGSFVVYGEGYAKLIRIGNASYAAELTLKAKAIKTGEQSKIIQSLNKFVWLAGFTIVPLGAIMVGQQLLRGATYSIAIEGMVAATLSMIPEGLFLLASVTLLLSAMRLAKQKVLLHDMKSIETLARSDVLCVDKTGTITSGKMQLEDTIWLGRPRPELLSASVAALSADSETMIALKQGYKKVRALSSAPKNIQGFSSRLKYSGVDFGPKIGTFVLGAPEFILGESIDPALAKQIESISTNGLRVLIFARYAGELENKALKSPATPLAIIVLKDELRKSAAKTFTYFAQQNVDIKVISGDAAATIAAIAKRAGIKNADKSINLTANFSDAELAEIARDYTVFGRVTPEGKRRLIKALQSAGHTVAMTGDGVNDVLALKDADCSIAMASGSAAAASVAQMVLLDSDFSKMPEIVAEGRRVVNNLERSGSLFIVKNIFSFTGALLTILLGIVYPMIPAQVSLVSFWAIGFPSFFLAQIPNTKLIKGDFMRNILRVALPTAIASVILIAFANFIARVAGLNPRFLGSISAIVWAGVGLVHLFLVARPFNKVSLGICLVCLFGSILSIFIASGIFGIDRGLGLPEWGIISVSIILAYPLIMSLRYVLRKVNYAFSH